MNRAAMPSELAASAVTDRDVQQLVDGMRSLDGRLVGQRWTVVGEWESFFARFVHVRNEDGMHMAIKFGRGWTAADTEFVSAEIARVRRLFAELPGGHVEVPPVLGWTASPAAITLPFIEGDNLFAALSDATHWLHSAGSQLDEIMQSSGEALGAYHAAETAPDDLETRRIARSDMEAAARRSGYRRSLVDRLERQMPVVRGYRLSHNDFTVGGSADDGAQLSILDPPHVRKFDHVHRDLSAFTLALHRALVGERHLRSPDRKLVRLRDSFLLGYRTTGPVALDTPLDMWLLRFYELSRIGSQLVGRVRGRQSDRAWRSMQWWSAERRALGSPPPI